MPPLFCSWWHQYSFSLLSYTMRQEARPTQRTSCGWVSPCSGRGSPQGSLASRDARMVICGRNANAWTSTTTMQGWPSNKITSLWLLSLMTNSSRGSSGSPRPLLSTCATSEQGPICSSWKYKTWVDTISHWPSRFSWLSSSLPMAALLVPSKTTSKCVSPLPTNAFSSSAKSYLWMNHLVVFMPEKCQEPMQDECPHYMKSSMA